MKKSIITLLIIAMLACIGLVSCKNEVQVPAEDLVSVSFENDSSRALSASLEEFKPGDYFWKYAAKKADASNLISGQTASYNEDGAQWIKEGKAGFGDDDGSYKVPGFSQGLWNFTLYGYKKIVGDNPATAETETEYYVLVYSGETTGVLLKSAEGYHTVSAVVSPAQGGNGTLWVKITGNDKITLDPAVSGLIPNTKIKLGIDKLETTSTTVIRPLSFIDVDYEESLAAGTYKVTVQFTNDDGGVVYASGSVVATVYSGLKTTVKGNLTEVVTYADFGATQNPDIITTTIGTSEITQGTTSSTVNFTSTTETKVTASMPTSAAKSLIAEMEQALDAKTSTAESATSELTLNLSVNTTAATETTITYEIGMEATLEYQKKDATGTDKTTTKSTVETLDDFVTVKIELQRGLTDVKVRHSDELMTACSSLSELNNKKVPGPDASEEAKAEARKGYFYYQDPYENDSSKAMLYIRTYNFSPFTLSYTVPKVVAIIGSQQFETLESAIAASTGSDTITMVSDVTLTKATQAAAKELTINLNGYTVSGSDYIGPSDTDNFFKVTDADYEYDASYIKICRKEVKIGDVAYKRLSEALAVAGEELEITLVRDVYIEFESGYAFTIPVGKSITLELNGYRVHGLATADPGGGSALIGVLGELTIKDSSDTLLNGTGTGGLFLLASDPDTRSIPGYASNVITNLGTLKVESGLIHSETEDSSGACFAIDSYSNNGKNVKLTVNGGKITAADSAAIRQAVFIGTTNDTVINGGVIGRYWIQNYGNSTSSATGTLVINNVTALVAPTLDLGYSIDYGYNLDGSGVVVTINGGSFAGLTVRANSTSKITDFLKGGTFEGNVWLNGDDTAYHISGGSYGDIYCEGTVSLDSSVTHGTVRENYATLAVWYGNGYVKKAVIGEDYVLDTGVNLSGKNVKAQYYGDAEEFIAPEHISTRGTSVTISKEALHKFVGKQFCIYITVSYGEANVAYEYYSGSEIKSKNYNIDYVLTKSSQWFCVGEWIRLLSDVEVFCDATINMSEPGVFGIKCGDFALSKASGVTVIIPDGVTVACDKDLEDFFSAPEGYSIRTIAAPTGYAFAYTVTELVGPGGGEGFEEPEEEF